MKKILPILFSFIVIFLFLHHATPVLAQPLQDDVWVQDPEVTFVGKAVTRANEFLDWTLREYEWVSINQGGSNPLASIWITIRNIVSAFLVVFIIVGALIMIVTRGRSVTMPRFIVRFGIILVLIWLSFSIIQILYQVFDLIQGFFLRKADDGTIIQSPDLLHIAFNYDFIGYRLTGAKNEESAFISLLLVRLTAITYYAMVGILLLRKIILWFFIIVSPIFPLLLFYYPIRNTAKIWIGEFFRWLLYAPLFAIFLNGLVSLWARSTTTATGIPLNFDFSKAGTEGDIVYPTAINILLGGPGQVLQYVRDGAQNSINVPDTFILYVVALLMLWVVILLPFLLLQIFLDYLRSISVGESSVMRQLFTAGLPLLNKYGFNPTPPGSPPSPGSYQPAGMAKQLPFINKATVQIPTIQSEKISQTRDTSTVQIPTIQSEKISQIREVSTEILRLTNISVPTMRDIARFETATLSRNIARHQEIAQTHETLERIANPARIANPVERQKFFDIKNKLQQAKAKRDPLATSILQAANTTTKVNTGQKGLSQISQRAPVAGSGVSHGLLPSTNRIQSVNLDEYESVKKMWVENYEKLEVPQALGESEKDRKEWVRGDIDKITQVINLLSSADQQNINQAMDMVGSILPFLLIGGFSQAEIVAYLKAKLEAAKTVLSQLEKQENEEETFVDVSQKEESKEMHQEASLPDPLETLDKKSESSDS